MTKTEKCGSRCEGHEAPAQLASQCHGVSMKTSYIVTVQYTVVSEDSAAVVKESVREDLDFVHLEREGYAVKSIQVHGLNNHADLEHRMVPAHYVGPKVEASNNVTRREWSVAVNTIAERYGVTLPKPRKGSPEWHVPSGKCHGTVTGLPGFTGELILTNGVKAILVRADGKWFDVHYGWFVPNKASQPVYAGLPQPKVKAKAKRVPDMSLEEYQ